MNIKNLLNVGFFIDNIYINFKQCLGTRSNYVITV